MSANVTGAKTRDRRDGNVWPRDGQHAIARLVSNRWQSRWAGIKYPQYSHCILIQFQSFSSSAWRLPFSLTLLLQQQQHMTRRICKLIIFQKFWCRRASIVAKLLHPLNNDVKPFTTCRYQAGWPLRSKFEFRAKWRQISVGFAAGKAGNWQQFLFVPNCSMQLRPASCRE